jgi:predicted metal-dependent hydrolase
VSGSVPGDTPGAHDPLDPLEAGRRSFNDGRYLDAHEEIEELWEATHDESSDFYKGLIQAAICLHHFHEGNLPGARKLYSGHRRYLAGYLPAHRGIDVAAFLDDMQSFLRPVLRAREGERVPFEGEARPRLRRAER